MSNGIRSELGLTEEEFIQSYLELCEMIEPILNKKKYESKVHGTT